MYRIPITNHFPTSGIGTVEDLVCTLQGWNFVGCNTLFVGMPGVTRSLGVDSNSGPEI